MQGGEKNPETDQKEEQKRIISELLKDANLVEGQDYYLLAINWWNTFKNWTGYIGHERWRVYDHRMDLEKPKPGPIDNSILLDESEGQDIVRKGKSDNFDFVLLNKPAWDQLVAWYGGGPPIIRPCIKQSVYHTSLYVEIRKLKLKIIWSRKPKEPLERWFSKVCTVGEFIETMNKELHFNKSKIQVYDFHNGRKLKVLDQMEKNLDEVKIFDGQYMLIEEQKKNGQWPSEKIYKQYAIQNQSQYLRTPTPPGKTGLSNLGNTCFMNSGIQCLSATVPLVDYFLKNNYVAEINETNPLGMKGEMAKEYATLLSELWSSHTSAVMPRDFKFVIGKYAPQFTGYAQHDSHELLAFLLDGLHEDLNRIKLKPYVAQRDSNGRPDEEVANEAWEGYKKRNNSIIVDLFQGQLKSRLRCPINGRVSNQFDPFMYLSVPIPVKTTRKILITFYPMDKSKRPIKYGVIIDKTVSIWDFKVALGEITKSKPESLIPLDMFCSRFYREFKNYESIDDMKDNDVIVVYEVASTNEDLPKHLKFKPKPKEEQSQEAQPQEAQPQEAQPEDPSSPPPKIRLPILIREEDTYSFKPSSIGIPFVLSVDQSVTYRQLYSEILDYMIKRNHLHPASPDLEGDIFKLFIYINSWTSMPQNKALADNEKALGLNDRETVVCEFSKANRQKYYREEVDLEGVEIDISARNRYDTGGPENVSLYDCLKLFSSEEQLGVNDAWYCTECKEHRQAFKKFDIWQAPQILVVHLKRFLQQQRILAPQRLDTLIDFPIDNLDLTEFVIGPKHVPPIYDLYAVSNHFGSMGGGHYTAHCRHRNDNQWFRYDDSSVSESSAGDVVSRASYVLFYRRKDVPWPIFDPALEPPAEVDEPDDDDDYDDEEEGATPTTDMAIVAVEVTGNNAPASE